MDVDDKQADVVSEKEIRHAATEAERNRATLHTVEGLALVMLCSSKPIIRKQAVIMLKEARNLFTVLNVPKVCLVISVNVLRYVVVKATPTIVGEAFIFYL